MRSVRHRLGTQRAGISDFRRECIIFIRTFIEHGRTDVIPREVTSRLIISFHSKDACALQNQFISELLGLDPSS